jgi:hypothetical protein
MVIDPLDADLSDANGNWLTTRLAPGRRRQGLFHPIGQKSRSVALLVFRSATGFHRTEGTGRDQDVSTILRGILLSLIHSLSHSDR